jgi:hypothetical protein
VLSLTNTKLSQLSLATVADEAGPTALPDTYSTYVGQAVTLDPTSNDISPMGSPLRFGDWITVPGLGTISPFLEGAGGQFLYTPQPGMEGVDTVNYTVLDNSNKTAVGVVTIAIGK